MPSIWLMIVGFFLYEESMERRYFDRRKAPGNGFTYVSIVGWICRREKRRRKNECREK